MLKISRESEINLINVLIDNDVISGKDLISIKKKSREAKKKRSEEKRSREERRDSLETKQIENPHFTGGKVNQNHKIVNIPITILAKTADNIER